MRKQFAFFAFVCVAGCSANPAPSKPREYVSVGYGMVDRNQLAGAVTSITQADINSMNFVRLEDVLRSRVPNLARYNDALVVLDGMPLSTGIGSLLATLSPKDVLRIDVLRDAGTAAIYGSRGGNGVIVIQTRR